MDLQMLYVYLIDITLVSDQIRNPPRAGYRGFKEGPGAGVRMGIG
jgi:hypothetical protein